MEFYKYCSVVSILPQGTEFKMQLDISSYYFANIYYILVS